METLYGTAAMTYNVHQLLHICKSVYNWGPLWAHFTFPFEAGNNKLLKTIHCAKGINQQIVRYTNIQCSMLILENKISNNISEATKRFCEDLITMRVKKCTKSGNITYFGLGDIIEHDIALKFNLSIYSTRKYHRIVKCGCLYTSCLLKNKRSNNAYALLNDGTYIKISFFILDIETNIALTICNKINVVSYNDSNFLCKIICIDTDLCTVATENIEKVCVYIKVNRDNYIAAVPNLLFY